MSFGLAVTVVYGSDRRAGLDRTMEISVDLASASLERFGRSDFFPSDRWPYCPRTGNTGGDIRHPEVRATKGATVTEGPIGAMIHVFEPDPDKFADAMTFSKWWWTFMMAAHFLGLILIIGTVDHFDIRICGIYEAVPDRTFAPADSVEEGWIGHQYRHGSSGICSACSDNWHFQQQLSG